MEIYLVLNNMEICHLNLPIYNILLFANEDAKKFIDSKEYLNNEYYKDLAQNLNITD